MATEEETREKVGERDRKHDNKFQHIVPREWDAEWKIKKKSQCCESLARVIYNRQIGLYTLNDEKR